MWCILYKVCVKFVCEEWVCVRSVSVSVCDVCRGVCRYVHGISVYVLHRSTLSSRS